MYLPLAGKHSRKHTNLHHHTNEVVGGYVTGSVVRMMPKVARPALTVWPRLSDLYQRTTYHLHRQTIPMHFAMFFFLILFYIFAPLRIPNNLHIHLYSFVIRVENPCCVRAFISHNIFRYCNFRARGCDVSKWIG